MSKLKLRINYTCPYSPVIELYHIETELIEITDAPEDYTFPVMEHYVYNNISYELCVSGTEDAPTRLMINDEVIPFSVKYGDNQIILELNNFNGKKPFLDSFGAVRIELTIQNKIYATENIYVRIDRNDAKNQNIIDMIEYIYDNSEEFLYEEHKYSKIATGIKKNQIVSIEAKLNLFQEILHVYQKCYYILKKNPYSKLVQTDKVDSFQKLQSVSSRTMQYIIQHVDELEPVAFYTGITVNKQNYQPKKTLMTTTEESNQVFENQVVISFLYTVLQNLFDMKKDLEQRLKLFQTPKEQESYVDSRVYIYKKSVYALNRYLSDIETYIRQFRKLYFHYSMIFHIRPQEMHHLPKYTAVFRANMPYRLIYEKIVKWFSCGNYHLHQHDLLLSFISTSKIYEYYCLVKFLNYFKQCPEFKKVEFSRFLYHETRFYKNTRYNNTFLFRWHNQDLTLFFQPVIYGKSYIRYNQIYLYRNTSSITHGEGKGNTYTPDFVIKLKTDTQEKYFIIDAKHSTTKTIRQYQMPELVYKYLFSISPLEQNASVEALYLFCGKNETDSIEKSDRYDNLHDIANSFTPKKKVSPFAELVTMTAYDVNNYQIIDDILHSFLNH